MFNIVSKRGPNRGKKKRRTGGLQRSVIHRNFYMPLNTIHSHREVKDKNKNNESKKPIFKDINLKKANKKLMNLIMAPELKNSIVKQFKLTVTSSTHLDQIQKPQRRKLKMCKSMIHVKKEKHSNRLFEKPSKNSRKLSVRNVYRNRIDSGYESLNIGDNVNFMNTSMVSNPNIRSKR